MCLFAFKTRINVYFSFEKCRENVLYFDTVSKKVESHYIASGKTDRGEADHVDRGASVISPLEHLSMSSDDCSQAATLAWLLQLPAPGVCTEACLAIDIRCNKQCFSWVSHLNACTRAIQSHMRVLCYKIPLYLLHGGILCDFRWTGSGVVGVITVQVFTGVHGHLILPVEPVVPQLGHPFVEQLGWLNLGGGRGQKRHNHPTEEPEGADGKMFGGKPTAHRDLQGSRSTPLPIEQEGISEDKMFGMNNVCVSGFSIHSRAVGLVDIRVVVYLQMIDVLLCVQINALGFLFYSHDR